MKKPPIIWLNTLLFAITFIGAVVLVPWRGIAHGFDGVEWLAFIVLAYASGLSITAGYHRLWSHKAYKAHPVMRVLFALGGALALQNSAIHWCSDHRVHHKHVDNNDKDPYSAKMGFWYSHIGWMLREYQASRYSDYNNVRDLQNDPILVWQHKHYLALVILMNIGLPAFLGWLNGDVISMVLMAGLLRLVVVHHCTFFINSLAHIWGKQPYTDKNSARDNAFLALLTYGEGYHNFHHIFENDYRNGIKWWDYDPTKWLIRLMSWVGLASDLRKVPQEKIESARLQMQLLKAQNQVAHLPNCDEIIEKFQAEYDLMKQHLLEYYQAKKILIEAKRKQLVDHNLKQQVQQLRSQFLERQRHWKSLTAAYTS
ncbi:acyl-CoA desaturase [Shewanella sp. OMA3-2]|uniref:acyl-CoA desaturase n=1 Tax=Shewanella sp. OMA3-2 TaxID=2908650 RepID=UPI001F1A8F6C|nr:fatty acid desaturase [Shewanella sp. OMA3-2]UJF22151.1 fatty acid desaturase [Shewanella sp. OMA3-2]